MSFVFRYIPPLTWLRDYRAASLGADIVSGLTLAAYAIPVSLAYASMAGLPPQVGIYGYLLGGLGYALLGSSRHLAVGPTSAISLMIASSVGVMAGGDALRYVQIASLAAFVVAALCVIAWLLRLSVLTKLMSDSILVGFKIGAGATIAMSQLPSLLGVSGGGHNFFERVVLLAGQLDQTKLLVLAIGIIAIVLLLLGEKWLPGRPVALVLVAASIMAATVLGLPALGVAVTGAIQPGLPDLAPPALRLRDVEGIMPLAAGCLLLAYVESVSAARAFASKHGYAVDPRQEFLGLGAANLGAALGQGYPVAGGLSQSAVNEKAGARTPLSLVFASLALALCLAFLTSLLENLPKAVLAAVVITAILGLFDFASLARMWRTSRLDFYAAAIALLAVLALGLLNGILVAAVASIVLLLINASQPHVAFLGRIPGANAYSDLERNPDNEPIPGIIAFRPEASLLYINADSVRDAVLDRLATIGPSNVRMIVGDLSASPSIDLAGARMLHEIHVQAAVHGIALRIVGARGRVRDLLRADGLSEKVGGLDRAVSLHDLLNSERS
jgi:SulP family sulfate permease